MIQFSIDVKNLYPSMRVEHVLKAVQYALNSVGDFDETRKQFIMELTEFCLTNASVQFRGEWFRCLTGITTGGSASVPFANIFLHYVTKGFAHDSLLFWARFVDDVYGGFLGTIRQFPKFLEKLNDYCSRYYVIFEVDTENNAPGLSVNFLDVNVLTDSQNVITSLYHKPTDARRYLNFKSYHPPHTFHGIVLSQMKRLAMINSERSNLVTDLDNIKQDFKDGDYPALLLDGCAGKILDLEITNNVEAPVEPADNILETITFVVTYSGYFKEVQSLLHTLVPKFAGLFERSRVVLAGRKNTSTQDLLFKRKHFAMPPTEFLSSNHCGRPGCGSCQLMNPAQELILQGTVFAVSKKANCMSKNCIYVAVCRVCGDFYIGRTQSIFSVRISGHRKNFNPNLESFKDSALSMHIKLDHPDLFSKKVDNFYFSILFNFNSGSPLDATEDQVITKTRALTLHLNRYKVKRTVNLPA